MNAKTTEVFLKANGETLGFGFEHAERLLGLPGSVWKLAENSPYEFIDNALRIKQNTEGNTRRKE